ncbi:hypothetical protein [Mycoplasma sp. 3686d]|uniref:hypothetical protein n=1 Tax=Mycoplasma sp. 3686d TaxID=2967300 RepID=UPI00211BFB75|nr:hypothetical protein [Mycoplasma sp. 3686d]UUM24863.1 hypothetical protein NPA12_00350 [Mycoplasma sp. 3686d]
MSLMSKLLKTVLIGVPVFSMITTSCAFSFSSNKDYLESVYLKTPYFINLIRMKQQDQGIKTNNSIIFDQFVESLHDKYSNLDTPENRRKYRNYNFLKDNKLLISSKQDFSNHIINKINSLYQELKLDKTLSDTQITKIFEADFLNSQSIENVLKNNNILILQSGDDRSPIGLKYALKEERRNQINILLIDPFEIKQKGDYEKNAVIKPYRSVFNVILFPKDKEFRLKRTTESENNQLLSDLYHEYALKAEQFYDWYHGGYVLGAISKIQNKQGIIYKQNLLLNNLTDESIKDLSLDSGLKIIKDLNHFNEFIIEPIQKVAQKLNSTLTNEAIINDFEINYLSGKKLNDVLKNSDFIVQRTIQKGNILSLNNPDRLVKLPSSSSSKINLTFINNRELEFNFIDKLEIKNRNRDKTPKIYYQVLIVPKGTQVEIKDKLNFKETNDFLLLNK